MTLDTHYARLFRTLPTAPATRGRAHGGEGVPLGTVDSTLAGRSMPGQARTEGALAAPHRTSRSRRSTC